METLTTRLDLYKLIAAANDFEIGICIHLQLYVLRYKDIFLI